MRLATVLGAAALVAALGCDEEKHWSEHPVPLADGAYHLAYGLGLTPEESASVAGLNAHLDLVKGQLTLTLPGQAAQVLTLAPRPRDQWQGDCFTMSTYTANEVADLFPRPVLLGALRFDTPLVHPKCYEGRLILADTYDGYAAGVQRGLAFDLE